MENGKKTLMDLTQMVLLDTLVLLVTLSTLLLTELDSSGMHIAITVKELQMFILMIKNTQ